MISYQIHHIITFKCMILVLIIPRAGCAHKLLWIIGGRNVGQSNIPDIEIFDTRNLTMISMKIPDADYTGGRDDRQRIVTNKIQYLAVPVLGTDAYPTSPPSYLFCVVIFLCNNCHVIIWLDY